MNAAVKVMWSRQIKEYVRNKQRLITALTQPLLYLIAFEFGIGGMFEKAGNGSYIQFLLPGIIGITLLTSSIMNGMSLIWDKQFGFLKETLVAPVSRTGLLFGRCLGGATTSTIQGAVILLLGFLIGFKMNNFLLIPLGIIIMFFISLLFNLLGTSIASKFDDMQSFPMIMNFLVMPMMFLSGSLFQISSFPKVIQSIAMINPLTYCVDLLRHTLNNQGNFNFGLDILVIGSIITALGIIGTKLFNKLET